MVSIIKNVILYFKERKARKKAQKETIERVINDYNELINQYRLVQERKSHLTRSQREFVVLRIKHLIFKGHIQVNK